MTSLMCSQEGVLKVWKWSLWCLLMRLIIDISIGILENKMYEIYLYMKDLIHLQSATVHLHFIWKVWGANWNKLQLTREWIYVVIQLAAETGFYHGWPSVNQYFPFRNTLIWILIKSCKTSHFQHSMYSRNKGY